MGKRFPVELKGCRDHCVEVISQQVSVSVLVPGPYDLCKFVQIKQNKTLYYLGLHIYMVKIS